MVACGAWPEAPGPPDPLPRISLVQEAGGAGAGQASGCPAEEGARPPLLPPATSRRSGAPGLCAAAWGGAWCTRWSVCWHGFDACPSPLLLPQPTAGKKGGAAPKGFSDHNAKWLKPKARQEEPSSEEEEEELDGEELSLSGEEFSDDDSEGPLGSDGASGLPLLLCSALHGRQCWLQGGWDGA